jgi:hypothetical protein
MPPKPVIAREQGMRRIEHRHAPQLAAHDLRVVPKSRRHRMRPRPGREEVHHRHLARPHIRRIQQTFLRRPPQRQHLLPRLRVLHHERIPLRPIHEPVGQPRHLPAKSLTNDHAPIEKDRRVEARHLRPPPPLPRLPILKVIQQPPMLRHPRRKFQHRPCLPPRLVLFNPPHRHPIRQQTQEGPRRRNRRHPPAPAVLPIRRTIQHLPRLRMPIVAKPLERLAVQLVKNLLARRCIGRQAGAHSRANHARANQSLNKGPATRHPHILPSHATRALDVLVEPHSGQRSGVARRS